MRVSLGECSFKSLANLITHSQVCMLMYPRWVIQNMKTYFNSMCHFILFLLTAYGCMCVCVHTCVFVRVFSSPFISFFFVSLVLVHTIYAYSVLAILSLLQQQSIEWKTEICFNLNNKRQMLHNKKVNSRMISMSIRRTFQHLYRAFSVTHMFSNCFSASHSYSH